MRADNSTGYLIESEALTADLRKTGLVSETPVRATGPFGTITADRMSLSAAEGPAERYLLVFKGKVKLVYQPK